MHSGHTQIFNFMPCTCMQQCGMGGLSNIIHLYLLTDFVLLLLPVVMLSWWMLWRGSLQDMSQVLLR